MTEALVRFEGEDIGWPGQPVLSGLHLTLHAGERLVLLGRSGAGKSTLLSAIRDRLPGRIALIPQDHGLVGPLSVHHNVWMGRLDDHRSAYNLLNLVRPLARERAATDPVIAEVGLSGFERRPVEALSGGQRQRTALARALFRGGDAVLGDEPVSAVDPVQGAALLEALTGRFQTLVLALHDREAALATATRIVGLKDGAVLIDAPARDLSLEALSPLYD
ncbi:ATP-binding cassette domain-containing protein [Pseudoroseicyclus aestuarii]|uniref:Phosphonate transport system ATP-binding protein n=1 Tax=Pseudoroseicyclus aestuarii TaxID=1795041 RepID=A0A318SRN6_9RHOB|nr:ATP-binding cassette domain-containing protein [Pseudoroseicyclus aestuarii]PYE84480.1 phosphonate transport system ATP-binding protein [Pseudoroseicyclus aestuarii]